MTAMDLLKLPAAYALTVEDYALLSDAGALDAFAKTELIEGVIVPVNALYSAHARAQRHFFREFDAACQRLSNGLEALFEVSVRIGPRTMPRPDVVLTREIPPNAPLPASAVALVLEVCDSTEDVDLGPKPRIYASAGIPEYWVADLNARVVHRMWQVNGDNYDRRDGIDFGNPIASVTITAMQIGTEGL